MKAKTQRVSLTIYRWFRDGKRVSWNHDTKHSRRVRAEIPTDLVGIMDALSTRARAHIPPRFVIHDLSSGGVALEAWPQTYPHKPGAIAKIAVLGLHPPLRSRRDPEIKGRFTLVPEALDDTPAVMHCREPFLRAFSYEQRQGWVYRRPRRNPELTRRVRAWSRLVQLIAKGRITIDELEGFVSRAARQTTGAR